jgi:precorrin-4/cobalt-precorrin-4 C11-methyltransferase
MDGDMKHPVVFVGAGPGDPELITVKGARALSAADLVLYAGSLVPKDLLNWCGEAAECIDSAPLALPDIIGVMATAHHRGKRVVRLHTGDPSLYGAVGEQFDELAKREIPYQVIPGVTAAFAAAAELGVEFTVPEKTQTLIFTRAAGRTPVPESESLRELSKPGAAMVIYLSMSLIGEVAAVLQSTYGEKAPVVVAHRVSRPEQTFIHTTTGRLATEVKSRGITKQAVVMVGKMLEQNAPRMRSRLYHPAFGHGARNIDHK